MYKQEVYFCVGLKGVTSAIALSACYPASQSGWAPDVARGSPEGELSHPEGGGPIHDYPGTYVEPSDWARLVEARKAYAAQRNNDVSKYRILYIRCAEFRTWTYDLDTCQITHRHHWWLYNLYEINSTNGVLSADACTIPQGRKDPLPGANIGNGSLPSAASTLCKRAKSEKPDNK
jgi:hypothetical protein